MLFEELGHLADLGDEHETAHFGVEILHRVNNCNMKREAFKTESEISHSTMTCGLVFLRRSS